MSLLSLPFDRNMLSTTSISWVVPLLSFAAVTIHPIQAAVVKESIRGPSELWTRTGTPPSDFLLSLHIALPQSDYATLEQHLYEISSPHNPRYGAFLTKAQVESYVKPEPTSVAIVEAWLSAHGIDISRDLHRSPAGDLLKIIVPVALAERMLSTTYHTWTHYDGTRVVRTTEYSLPAELHPHIEFIQPTTFFSHRKKRHTPIMKDSGGTNASHNAHLRRRNEHMSGRTIDSGCETKITVECLKQIYNVGDYRTNPDNGNTIAVTGYLEEYANKDDLQAFYAQQRPDAVNSTFEEIFINGGINSQNRSLAGPEASLDSQFAFGLTFPTHGIFYSTGGQPPFIADLNEPTNNNEPYLDFLEYLLSHPNVPRTISTSYGDDEQTVPRSYALRVCRGFAQLGARGVSLLFGAGDSGVAGSNSKTEACITNDGRNATRFIPNFPASCPFVTTVGATQGFKPETATTGFASGGGFSDYFERPQYADAAVSEFFKQFPKDTYRGKFNPNGAPIPDVAAQGDHYQIIFEGTQLSVGGASAATPTFASIIAMLNDARINKGKPTLGWLNPLLYDFGRGGLTDIVEGSNPGCGTPGFNATKGWDPVSGLGTPDFKRLKDIVTAF